MHINPIFSSFISIEELTDIDNDLLQVYCKQKIKLSGKQNQSDYLNVDDIELKPLVGFVNNLCNTLHNQIGLNPDKPQRISRIWANSNNNIAIDQPHIHPNSIFSGVYYPFGNEKSGHLKLMNPVMGFGHVLPNSIIKNRTEFTCGEIAIPPAQGRLIIFPAWLMHYVTLCFDERISIAFDTSLV